MGNVVSLFKPEPEPEEGDGPTAHGEAFCLGCGHVWEAVAPVGVTRFECPSCHAEKGLWKFEFMLPIGSLVRECDCGNQLFYCRRKAIYAPTAESTNITRRSINLSTQKNVKELNGQDALDRQARLMVTITLFDGPPYGEITVATEYQGRGGENEMLQEVIDVMKKWRDSHVSL